MRFAALAPMLIVACTAPPPAPDPIRVEPPWGFTDADTTVRVVGTSFFPSLGVSATGGDEVVDDGFAVRLLDDEGRIASALVGVALEDLNTLVGVVPAGLPSGTYDVEVVAPSGQIGVEEDAFSIRPTRVERIDLEVDDLSHEVFSEAEVTVSLQGQDGDRVPEDLPVRLVFARTDGAELVGQVRLDGLEDAVTTRETSRIVVTGRMGQDGVAKAYPLLENPGEIEVTAEAPDAPVRVVGDDLRVAWTRGRSLTLRVDLPTPGFTATAGEPFTATLVVVDQYGNDAPDVVVSVALTDACASVALGVRVAGREDVPVTALQATNTTRCPVDRLLVGGAGISGESEPFEVLPAAPQALEVVAGPTPLRAGQTLSAFVSAVDAWGNLTPWSGVVTSLDDGSLGLSDVVCSEPDQLAFCVGEPRRTAVGARLRVTSEEGLVGLSNALTVRAGPPARLDAQVSAVWEAGTPEPVAPSVLDAWGNVSATAVVVPGSLRVTDPRGEVTCGTVGAVLSCTLRTATASTRLGLVAEVTDDGVTQTVVGESSALSVVHGPLADVVVTPGQSAVVAGTPIGVTLAARDAWSNPYTDAAGTPIRLTDTLGGLAPVTVPLGASGSATTSVTLRKAGSVRIEAWLDGKLLGRSVPVEVSAGPPSRLDLTVFAPWAWVGEAAPFRVDAVDAEGNPVAPTDSVLRIVSREGAGDDVQVALVNGTATGSFVWDAAVSFDALLVETTSGAFLAGASDERAVMRRCGPAGPVASVRFAGQTFARACFDPSGRASVAGDFATSTAGVGRTLVDRGLAIAGVPFTSTTSRVTITTTTAGIHPLDAFVRQDDGCGAETTADLFVGPDDGGVVGPLGVQVVGDADLRAAIPEVEVRLTGVTTCHGVPAAGAPVRLRADRGTLLDPVPSGQGLEVRADGAGTGRATLSFVDVLEGGDARVTAWGPAGSAYGEADFVLLGDRGAPTVVAQTPEGNVTAPVEQVVLTFSEPMDPASFVAGAVDLRGPDARSFTLTLTEDDTTLVVEPDLPLEPSGALWLVGLGPTLTDRAGNPLDGAWSGRASRYEGLLGVASTPVLLSSCQADVAVLRPDGDEGVGADDRDEVLLSFTASARPAWWVIAVEDDDGGAVLRTQVPADAAVGAWTWDARDLTGRVVPTGYYTLSVAAEDAVGNRGNTCARTVVVDLVEG